MNVELKQLMQQARAAARQHKDRTLSFGEYRRKVWAEAEGHVRLLLPPALQQHVHLEISDVELPGICIRGHIVLFKAIDICFYASNQGSIDYVSAEHRWELRHGATFEVHSSTDTYRTNELLLALAKAEDWQKSASEAESSRAEVDRRVHILTSFIRGRPSISP